MRPLRCGQATSLVAPETPVVRGQSSVTHWKHGNPPLLGASAAGRLDWSYRLQWNVEASCIFLHSFSFFTLSTESMWPSDSDHGRVGLAVYGGLNFNVPEDGLKDWRQVTRKKRVMEKYGNPF